jgi:hypothetical protein
MSGSQYNIELLTDAHYSVEREKIYIHGKSAKINKNQPMDREIYKSVYRYTV